MTLSVQEYNFFNNLINQIPGSARQSVRNRITDDPTATVTDIITYIQSQNFGYILSTANLLGAPLTISTAVASSSPSTNGFTIAGSGLTSSGSTVSAKIDGLTITTNGLGALVSVAGSAPVAGNGISVSGSTVSLAATTAGAGLTHTNGVLDIVAADFSLTVTPNNIAVQIGTLDNDGAGAGTTTHPAGLEVIATANSGTAGLGVKVDGTTITIDSTSGALVATGPVAGSGIAVSSGTVSAKLTTTTNKGGLEFDAGDSGLTIKLDANSGLNLLGGDLAVGAGTGITVSGNTVSLDPTTAGAGLTHTTGVLDIGATDASITVAADAIKVNIGTIDNDGAGGGTTTHPAGLEVITAANSGTAGLGVKVDGTTITIDSTSGALVATGPVAGNGIAVSSGTVSAKLTITTDKGGLEFDAGDSGLTIKLDANGGLNLLGGDLAVGAGTGITVSSGTVSLTYPVGDLTTMSGNPASVVAILGTPALNTAASTIVDAINELVPKVLNAPSLYTTIIPTTPTTPFQTDYDACMGSFTKTASLEECCFRYAILKEFNTIGTAITNLGGTYTTITDLDCASFH